MVDTNHDGVIEFHEFLAAMAEWMQEDLSKSGSQKKRGRMEEVRRPSPVYSVPTASHVPQERADTHKKIKGFFSQFRKPKNFDQIRYKLALQKEKAERGVRAIQYHEPLMNARTHCVARVASPMRPLMCHMTSHSVQSLTHIHAHT